MHNIKNLIFDLDGTLYPYSQSMEDDEDKKSIDFVSNYLSVDRDKAWKIVQSGRANGAYETTFLLQEYQIPPQQYLEYVCNIDVSFVQGNPDLAKRLSSIKQAKYIYTDSTQRHVSAVLKQLQINKGVFKKIYDASVSQYQYKYSFQGFEAFFSKSKLLPQESMMFEDSLRNIKNAKSFGMKTVYIGTKHHDIKEADYIFPDINSALNFLF